jgi:hypothetical protein
MLTTGIMILMASQRRLMAGRKMLMITSEEDLMAGMSMQVSGMTRLVLV